MAKNSVEPIEEYGLSKKAQPETLFSKIGIVGCGQQGSFIAQIISGAGMDVVFIEVCEEKIQEAYGLIEGYLDAQIARWGMTDSEKKAIIARITGTTDWSALNGCDLVLEAIHAQEREKRVEMRKEIFKKIEEQVPPQTIIASNTTTLAITELSSDLKHQDRCVSIVFFASSSDANMIEVSRGIHTSEDTYQKVRKFATLLDKEFISVEESAGLISVRLTVALVNEACDLFLKGVSSMEDIDRTMTIGLGQRFGPFEIADKIGLDKVIRWMENLYSEFGDLKFKPSPLLRKLVRANFLGRKVGRGFYEYDENGNKVINPSEKIF